MQINYYIYVIFVIELAVLSFDEFIFKAKKYFDFFRLASLYMYMRGSSISLHETQLKPEMKGL